MTVIAPPPADDAPYEVQLRYYRGLADMSPNIIAADAIVRCGASWLRDHGEIDETEYRRLTRLAREANR